LFRICRSIPLPAAMQHARRAFAFLAQAGKTPIPPLAIDNWRSIFGASSSLRRFIMALDLAALWRFPQQGLPNKNARIPLAQNFIVWSNDRARWGVAG
jgi:hypothetical protein